MKNFFDKNAYKKFGIPAIFAGIGGIALLHSQNSSQQTEITKTPIVVEKIISKTNHSVKNILNAENLCQQNEKFILKNIKTENEKIFAQYQCEKVQNNDEIPSTYGSPNPF